MTVTEKRQNKVKIAATVYQERQARLQHPEGEFDDAGRWYPSERERQSCCEAIREPSRRYPHSLNKHCRSLDHICNLYNLTERQRAQLRKLAYEDRDPFWGDIPFYKQVAIVDGELRSIYDDSLYEIGKARIEKALPKHNGGHYVYRTAEEAREAKFPDSSINLNERRVLIEVNTGGRCQVYQGGKLAYTGIKPVGIIQEVTS